MSTSRVRALACALVSTLLAQPAWSAPPSSRPAAGSYAQAQELLEAGNYVGAAEIWEDLLGRTPESPDTASRREAMICNAIDSRVEAYGRQLTGDGEKEPLHLVEGQIAMRRYLRAHAAAYGDSKAVSAPVLERAATLAVAMDNAQPERLQATVSPDPPPQDRPQTTRSAPSRAPHNGTGLLVGGIGLGVLGLATGLTMVPLGAALGRNAENIYTVATINAANTTSEPQRSLYLSDAADARRAGRTSNRVAIAGGVLSPLMLGGAAVMIAIGLQRQSDTYRRVQHGPQFSPDYAGYEAALRF